MKRIIVKLGSLDGVFVGRLTRLTMIPRRPLGRIEFELSKVCFLKRWVCENIRRLPVMPQMGTYVVLSTLRKVLTTSEYVKLTFRTALYGELAGEIGFLRIPREFVTTNNPKRMLEELESMPLAPAPA